MNKKQKNVWAVHLQFSFCLFASLLPFKKKKKTNRTLVNLVELFKISRFLIGNFSIVRKLKLQNCNIEV